MELRPAEPGIESVYACLKSTKVCIGLSLIFLSDHWLCVSSYHSFFCPYKSIEVDISLLSSVTSRSQPVQIGCTIKTDRCPYAAGQNGAGKDANMAKDCMRLKRRITPRRTVDEGKRVWPRRGCYQIPTSACDLCG